MIDILNDNDLPEYERPNKSKLKREAQASLKLAKDLVELNASVWKSLSLPDELIEELHHLKDMPQFGAKKRQLKLVAKLLRQVDVSGAERAVADAVKQHADVNAAFHKVEYWRDRLLSGQRDDLTEFLKLYPDANAQQMNQLLRNAKQEILTAKSAKSSKLLFKLLREITTEA